MKNRSRNKRFTVLLFFIFFSLIPLSAEKIIFSANRMTGQAGNSSTTTTLSGNAYIKTETMEIQADDVELSGDNYRYIKASGNITGKNTESHMDFTCESLEYDRTTKIALLKGNVKLDDKDNDVRAESQIIEYNQDLEIAILQVQIRLTQKDNICTGSYAVYYKTSQLLEISGNAQVQQKEDVFRAQNITLDMNTQDITLGGNVKGKVTDTKKADEKDKESSDKSEQAARDEDSGADEDSEENEESEASDAAEETDMTKAEKGEARDGRE